MDGRQTEFECADGVVLRGHWWGTEGATRNPVVIINPATGVKAAYYHRYAAFLAEHGFAVLTYDYRGIGLSRPAGRLRGSGFTWRQWGEQDFEAALAHALAQGGGDPLVVGHSIGGFLPGYAPSAARISRLLTVGAQYAYWPDYRRKDRLSLFLKWHVAMPAITLALGFFPGRGLGWLEDLPAGVALEWSFRGSRMEARMKQPLRTTILDRFAAVQAPMLALSVSDDPFATHSAVNRALSYYTSAERLKVMLEPADLGVARVGHFDLFHARHGSSFWIDSLLWLRDGINPWPGRVFV